MIEPKYIELSEKIAIKIQTGEWKGRMPGVIKLSRELNVNPATVAKAFKILEKKGILSIDGTRGSFINNPKPRPQYKMIGVIGISDSPIYAEEWHAMEAATAKAGYRIIGIAHNNELFVNDMEILLRFPVDGFIFLYSSLTYEIATFLRKHNIMFVACSNTVGIPDVNFVDFDPENIFEKSLRHLIDRNHRRITYI